MTHST